MSAVERFIAGEDRLSATLKAMPAFDAPAQLLDWLQETALAIEAERRTEPAYAFEPSANLHDTVMREARAMERAQAPRRAVLWNRLGRDESAADVLGAPVAATTEAWLRQQAARHPATPPVTAPIPRPSRQRWWGQRLAFGAVFGLALLVGVVGHRYWLGPANNAADAAPQVALLEPQIVAEPPAQVATAEAMEQNFAEMEAKQVPPSALARRREPEQRAGVAAFALPPPPAPAAEPALDYDRMSAAKVAPPPPAPAKPQLLAQNKRADMAPVRLEAERDTPSYLYPVTGPQWKRLAADVFAANKTPPSRSWRLSTNDPAAAEVVALAVMLREALHAGMSLTVEADPTVPAGSARLAPVEVQ